MLTREASRTLAVVTLDFPVVAGRIGGDALVPASRGRISEGVGAVAGAVVCDDAFGRGDAMYREPCAGAGSDRRRGFLVVECFGVCQAGVAVDRGVQIHVALPRAPRLGAVDGFGLRASFAVHAPSAADCYCQSATGLT